MSCTLIIIIKLAYLFALQKSSPNRAVDDAKAKSESSKKSPTKEKKEEKVEKPKPKERPTEAKIKKEVTDKKNKKKAAEVEKPEDFDDGLWQEVPKKSTKKVKSLETHKYTKIIT